MKQMKPDSIVLKLAVLFISFTMMIRMTISPVLASMMPTFASQGVTFAELLNMMSVMSLAAIPAAILSSFLTLKFPKKPLTLLGLFLYGVAGTAPVFLTQDFNAIVISRIIGGIGVGLFLPMANGLIADFWDGDDRQKMVGWQSSMVGVGNIITGLLAGFLAVISWNLGFLIYVFVIIAFFVVLFLVPEPPKQEAADQAGKKIFNMWVFFIPGAMILYALGYYTFFGYISFLVEQNAIGNAGTAGIAQTCMTAVSMVLGFVYYLYAKKTGKFLVFFSLVLNAVGYVFLAFTHSLPMLFFGSAFVGLGFGTLMPTSMKLIYERAPKSSITFGTGLIYTGINIGTGVGGVIFGNITENANQAYTIVAIGLAIAAAVSLLMALLGNRKTPAAE